MPLIRAFPGLRPASGYAAQVAAPPYDVLNTEEARQRAKDKPWSFLHISKPEIDLPPSTDPFAPEVYAKGKQNFQRMLQQGILQQDSQPCYYLYRLIMGQHQQVGLVATASVKDYDSNRIRKHEYTRPDKEDDRVRQIKALNAQTGPVFLTYRHHDIIDELVERVTENKPVVDITADDGVRHSLWVVDDASLITTISSTFDKMDCLYIADGHHRSAAASRVAEHYRNNNKTHTGEESCNYFLSVIFPDDQMKILDYNRVVKDLNGLSQQQFLLSINKSFQVTETEKKVKPQAPGEFGMYLASKWYRLIIKPDLVPRGNPVKRLDVSLLADYLIAPVLGINDPRRDKRIDFVGGIRGLEELEKRVDSGEMKVAFSLYSTSLSELMAVADAGDVMPPKSTWFEPKLADGLVSHIIG